MIKQTLFNKSKKRKLRYDGTDYDANMKRLTQRYKVVCSICKYRAVPIPKNYHLQNKPVLCGKCS